MKLQSSNFRTFTLKALFTILCIVVTAGCKLSVKKDKEADAARNIDSEKIAEQKELNIVDTGQVYFKVMVKKNNHSYINYEGDYPVGSRFDSNFTIQLCASKHILDVSNMLNIDIYIKKITTGNFPVIANSQPGKATMNMTPAKDGSYGISFSPDNGKVVITKYTDSLISGKFQAYGIDADSNKISISGLFLNVKYSDLSEK